jgi:hypothetical protein
MKKIILIFCIILFLYVPNLFSNDSGIRAVGGSWVVMKDEHPSVQMARETIDMNVYKEYYDVVAEFTFKNNGDACDVYMGFPESGSGDTQGNWDTTTAFLSFSTTVDGVEVTAKRVFVKNEEFEYGTYWIKQVSFKKNETKKIIVKYRSPLGGGFSNYTGGYENFMGYHFSGGNWHGKVLESKLNIYFQIPVELAKQQDCNIKKESDHYTYYMTNWEAEEYFSVSFRIKE